MCIQSTQKTAADWLWNVNYPVTLVIDEEELNFIKFCSSNRNEKLKVVCFMYAMLAYGDFCFGITGVTCFVYGCMLISLGSLISVSISGLWNACF